MHQMVQRILRVTGLSHILRARNFIQSNEFDEEGFLAKCHWHFSPVACLGHDSETRPARNQFKKPPNGGISNWCSTCEKTFTRSVTSLVVGAQLLDHNTNLMLLTSDRKKLMTLGLNYHMLRSMLSIWELKNK